MEEGNSKKARSSQAAQKVRPARPQAESKPEAYPLGYVEDFDEPRTKLAGFFSNLLSEAGCLPIDHPHSCQNQRDAKNFTRTH